jgi:hypothetical protein
VVVLVGVDPSNTLISPVPGALHATVHDEGDPETAAAVNGTADELVEEAAFAVDEVVEEELLPLEQAARRVETRAKSVTADSARTRSILPTVSRRMGVV